jgi:hypothetical protein
MRDTFINRDYIPRHINEVIRYADFHLGMIHMPKFINFQLYNMKYIIIPEYKQRKQTPLLFPQDIYTMCNYFRFIQWTMSKCCHFTK